MYLSIKKKKKKIIIVSRPLRSDCFTIEHLKLTCDKNKKRSESGQNGAENVRQNFGYRLQL